MCDIVELYCFRCLNALLVLCQRPVSEGSKKKLPFRDFSGGAAGRGPPADAGHLGSILGLE